MAKPRRLNLVSIVIYLLLFGGAYLVFRYTPIYWKKSELQTLVKEVSYSAKRRPEPEVRAAFVREAKNQLGIKLNPDDVIIDRLSDRVKVYVVWRVQVKHPLGKITRHAIQIEQETLFF